MASGEEGFMDLDRLIQSCEFENQQYVKLIEKEYQLIEALEKEIEVKQKETLKLEEATTQLDEDTKRAHKQFTLNRDNCESLRKTAVVLMEHEVALNRKFNSIIDNGEKERAEHNGIVTHYDNIYADYMMKYRKFPHVEEIERLEEEITAKEKALNEVEEKVSLLKTQIEQKQGGADVNFKDLNKFIIKLAEMKVDTQSAVRDKTKFEMKLREIQIKRNETTMDEEALMDRSNPNEDFANTTANDSLGEDISPMIGIFHNKSDSAEGQEVYSFKKPTLHNSPQSGTNHSPQSGTNHSPQSGTNHSPQSGTNHSPQSVMSQLPQNGTSHTSQCDKNQSPGSDNHTSVEDVTMPSPEEGSKEEIPVTRMSEIHIGSSQTFQSPPSQRTAPFSNLIPMEVEASCPASTSLQSTEAVQPLPQVTQRNLSQGIGNRVPLSGNTDTQLEPSSTRVLVQPTSVSSQSPSVRMPLTPTLVPRSPLIQPRSQSFGLPQPLLIKTTFNRPKQSSSPQVSVDPKLTPKIKHGINSIQVKPAIPRQLDRQNRPTLLLPSQEQRKVNTPSPRLPTHLIRAPPRLPLPPPPPQTPDAYKGLDPMSRFISPISQPLSHPHVTSSPASRQLYTTPVTTPQSRSTASPTATVSCHFEKQDTEDIPMSTEDKATEESRNGASYPTTPKTPKSTGDASDNSQSPFNLEKHLETIKLLSTSPGGPLYAQRPMFDETETRESSPGPFLQGFQTKTTKESNQFANKSSIKTSSAETKTREMKSLFGGQETPGKELMQETSFSLQGMMQDSPDHGNFLSMFASGDFKSPASAKSPSQNDFSFSFGQNSTQESTKPEFSFSFGASSDIEERSSSVFNLF